MPKLFCLLLVPCLSIAAMAQSSLSNGLTSANIARLRSAGKVVVPTYIPPHFKLTKLTVGRGDYDITYSGPKGATLDIEMASDGIGDVILDPRDENAMAVMSTKTVTNPLFGKHWMDVLTTEKEPNLASTGSILGRMPNPSFFASSGFK